MKILEKIKNYFDCKDYLGEETWKSLQDAKKNPCILGFKDGRVALFERKSELKFIRFVEDV